MGEASQGPAETIYDRIRRAPNVLRTYANDLEKYGRPLDSHLVPWMRKLADALQEAGRTDQPDAPDAISIAKTRIVELERQLAEADTVIALRYGVTGYGLANNVEQLAQQAVDRQADRFYAARAKTEGE